MTSNRAGCSNSAEAPESSRLISLSRVGFAVLIALGVANCARQQVSSVDPKLGVAPSPRVVADGEPVPKGGGRSLTGKPYVIAGKVYKPMEDPRHYSASGTASWYGDAFHGRLTANGEIFDKNSIAAAHPTLPLPSYVRITNLLNHRSMIVRVNDRGPYHGHRLIDVSRRVAEALDFKRIGTASVKVDYMGPASIRGSDDRKLIATLRTDGMLAQLPAGSLAPVMVASADPEELSKQHGPQPARFDDQVAAQIERTQPKPNPVLAAASLVPLTKTAATAEPSEPVQIASGKPVSGIPVPPERPFDLETIPGAGVPMASAPVAGNSLAGARVASASLFYAANAQPGHFSHETVVHLTPQDYISFK